LRGAFLCCGDVGDDRGFVEVRVGFVPEFGRWRCLGAGFTQGAAVLVGDAVQRDGVVAQTERHRE
jgi:hypothetical protein